MPYNDLLLALASYPEPTPVAAIDQAVGIAGLLGARISAVTFELQISKPVSFYTDAVLDISGMIAEAQQKSLANAQGLLNAFETAATRHGVFQENLLERCLPGEAADILVEHARLRDLTLIPVRDADSVEQWYAETVIFGSGRPTLVLPEASRRGRAPALDTVAIAWDFSRPAARAVADVLPLLERAKRVRVVTVVNEKDIASRRSGAELARHLARHGIDIALDEFDSEGRGIGEALEAYVDSRNADLLVMGAYGHSRVREFILGGATRSVLARPPVPVFLSH
jgi:nucleotide-binding universal stress UspA family protein